MVIHKFTFSDAFQATVGDFFQKNGSAIILAALTGLIVAIIGLVVKRIPGLSKNESDNLSVSIIIVMDLMNELLHRIINLGNT